MNKLVQYIKSSRFGYIFVEILTVILIYFLGYFLQIDDWITLSLIVGVFCGFLLYLLGAYGGPRTQVLIKISIILSGLLGIILLYDDRYDFISGNLESVLGGILFFNIIFLGYVWMKGVITFHKQSYWVHFFAGGICGIIIVCLFNIALQFDIFGGKAWNYLLYGDFIALSLCRGACEGWDSLIHALTMWPSWFIIMGILGVLVKKYKNLSH